MILTTLFLKKKIESIDKIEALKVKSIYQGVERRNKRYQTTSKTKIKA